MKKNILKITALALLAVMLCAMLVACGGPNKDPEKAKEALSKNDCVVSVTKVIGVEIPDAPGGLSEVLELMSANNINVEYLYAFITISGKHAYVVLRVEDNEKAAKILTENGVKLVTQNDIDAL